MNEWWKGNREKYSNERECSKWRGKPRGREIFATPGDWIVRRPRPAPTFSPRPSATTLSVRYQSIDEKMMTGRLSGGSSDRYTNTAPARHELSRPQSAIERQGGDRPGDEESVLSRTTDSQNNTADNTREQASRPRPQRQICKPAVGPDILESTGEDESEDEMTRINPDHM